MAALLRIRCASVARAAAGRMHPFPARRLTWTSPFPSYARQAIRHVIAEALQLEDGMWVSADGSRCAATMAFEDSIKVLALSVGGGIRVRATGLPIS
jgi:hypothetical protein